MKISPSLSSSLFFIRCVIGYAGYGFTYLVFMLLLPLLIVFIPFRRALKRLLLAILSGYLFILTRIYLPALGIYSFNMESQPPATGGRAVIYVANHRCVLDALILMSMLYNPGVIIKPKYTRSAVLSKFVKYLNFVSVDPSSIASIGAAMTRCGEILRSGTSLLIFPEGSRAIKGKLQPFKDFAFQLAQKHDIEIVPVVIHTDLPFMSKVKGSYFPKHKLTFTIRFLPPMRCSPNRSAGVCAEKVHALIAEQLQRLDRATPWEQKKESP
jgi:1-acyl-sn-glycerol-3-phosphate acyltransferase